MYTTTVAIPEWYTCIFFPVISHWHKQNIYTTLDMFLNPDSTWRSFCILHTFSSIENIDKS